jgi:hypothetical protein
VHRGTFGNVASPEVAPREIEQNQWGFESSNTAAVKVRGDVAQKAVQTSGTDTVRQSVGVWYMPFIRRTAIRYPHGLMNVLITCATPMTDDVSMILQWVYRNDTEQQVSTADVIAFDRAITLEDKAIIESCDPDVPLAVIEGEGTCFRTSLAWSCATCCRICCASTGRPSSASRGDRPRRWRKESINVTTGKPWWRPAPPPLNYLLPLTAGIVFLAAWQAIVTVFHVPRSRCRRRF